MERMLQDIDKVSAPGSTITIVSKKVDQRLRDEASQCKYDTDQVIFRFLHIFKKNCGS